MKKCIDCGRAFYTWKRCQSCGKEVNAATGEVLNFCLLCHVCSAAIEKGLDLKQYREKKKQRMKRCLDCINDRDAQC